MCLDPDWKSLSLSLSLSLFIWYGQCTGTLIEIHSDLIYTRL